MKTIAVIPARYASCLLYTSDAADERYSVDLGGPRINKKKKKRQSIITKTLEQQSNTEDVINEYMPIQI